MQITNPAFDYDGSTVPYAAYRRTDPRIAAQVHAALGPANTVLNVGAGAGSYEPADRYVVAVEPSAAMRARRRELGRAPAIDARADSLPFDDGAFDASMAMVTVHHWPDIGAGIRELRRVTKEQVLILTFDPDALDRFWNVHYFPELVAVERARYPKISELVRFLGGSCEVQEVAVPLDCADGFQEAYYGRPEAFLDPEVRRCQSAWGFLAPGLDAALVIRLRRDLESGDWDSRFGHFRTLPSFTCALRLLVARP